MCEIHKARLLQACSPGAPLTPMTGCHDFRRAWQPTPGEPCVSATSFLRLSQFVYRCCQSGNFLLLRCNESRTVGLAVLFLLLGDRKIFFLFVLQLLQNANDLAALRCTPYWQPRAKKENSVDRSSSETVHRAFEPTATSTESNTSGYLQRGSCLLLPFTHAYFEPL